MICITFPEYRFIQLNGIGLHLLQVNFNHSLICDNDHYVGIWTANGGVEPIKKDETYHETNIRKSGTVKLVEVKTEGLPKRYLNLAPDSDGLDTEAGVFKSVQ